MSDKVALTPEEQRRLLPLFKQYDLDSSSIVLGDKIRPLLESSGLPPQTLGQIWQIVDVENRGFLEFAAFARCLRLVAHAQAGQPVSPRLANVPSSMPDFSNPVLSTPTTTGSKLTSPKIPGAQHPAPLAALGTGTSILSANGETSIPPLTSENKKRFGLLFDKSVTPPAQFINGEAARDIFLKAKLPQDVLGHVWELVDVENRGELTKNEFVLAMHLIQSLMDHSMPNLPSQLPAVWQPWLGGARPPLGPHASGTLATLAGAPLGPPPPRAPRSNSLARFGISRDDKARYDSIFDDLDPQGTGILGPAEAVPVLTRSKLPEDVLARIWDLADTQKRGQLDKHDFALAMHYLRRKMNGKSLPNELPGEPSASAVAAGAAAAAAGAASAAASASAATAVPGSAPAAAPAAMPAAPPSRVHANHTSSALSDLVSLDGFKPLEPARTAQASFKPATAFGQQLLGKSRAPAFGAPVFGALTESPEEDAPRADAARAEAARAEAAKLKTQADAQQAELARGRAELAQVLERQETLDAEVRALRETYDSSAKEVHDVQQQVKDARQRIAELEADLALRSSGLTAIKQQSETETAELATLAERRAALEAEVASAQAEIAKLETDAAALREQSAEHTRTIAEHEAQLPALAAEVERLRNERAAAEAEMLRQREHLEQARSDAQTRATLVEEERAALETAQRAAAEAPPAGDAAYSPVDAALAFALPMSGRMSPTLSTDNNPPQSVRSDFDDASEQPSPPRTPGDHRDSSPFVDAPERPEDALSSSDDDEGPASAVPRSYGSHSPFRGDPIAAPAFAMPRSAESVLDSMLGSAPEPVDEFESEYEHVDADDISGEFDAPQATPAAPPAAPPAVAEAEPASAATAPATAPAPAPTAPLEPARDVHTVVSERDSTTPTAAAAADDATHTAASAPVVGSIPSEPPTYAAAVAAVPTAALLSAAHESPAVPKTPTPTPAVELQSSPFAAGPAQAATDAIPVSSQPLPAAVQPTHAAREALAEPAAVAAPVSAPAAPSPTAAASFGHASVHQTDAAAASSVSAPVAAPFAPVTSAAAPVVSTSPRELGRGVGGHAFADAAAPAPAASADFDDFDEFSDLQEAEEDDYVELESPAPASQDAAAEWQRLFAAAPPSVPSPSEAAQPSVAVDNDPNVVQLTSMGFSPDSVREALRLHNNDLGNATNHLIDQMQ